MLEPEQPLSFGRWNRSELLLAAASSVSGLLMVASLWGTWFRILGSSGNSFRMLNTTDLIGLDQFATLRVFWFLIPVLYSLGLVGLAARKFALAGILQAVISLPVLLSAVALLLVGVGAWGATAATLAALSSTIFSVALVVGGVGIRRKASAASK